MTWNGWLQCKIHKGMFPDEVGVIVQNVDGHYLSFFLPRTFIRSQNGAELTSEEIEAQVKVQVFDQDESVTVVGLPREPFQGSRFARVARKLVATA